MAGRGGVCGVWFEEPPDARTFKYSDRVPRLSGPKTEDGC